MATSSILDHITINNPKVVEDYVNAMKEDANTPFSNEAFDIKFETDSNVLKELKLKGIDKWGNCGAGYDRFRRSVYFGAVCFGFVYLCESEKQKTYHSLYFVLA